jgi:hypothetical protein
MVQERVGLSPQAMWFWVLSRPVFRAVDFYTSYASARRARPGAADSASASASASTSDHLPQLAARKREFHRELASLSASHGDSCTECRGGCCKEERFRDSLVDRLLMTGAAPANVAPRSLRDAARERHTGYPPLRDGAGPSSGYCPRCTHAGCVIPPEDRPVQCLAYQCRATIATLSEAELETGLRAITGLMRVMVETAHVAGR